MSSKIDRLIRKWDDPILKQVCEPVRAGDDLSFLEVMEKVCRKAGGVGIAAPQIGVAKCAIYLLLNNGRGIRGEFMLNPLIAWASAETDVQEEGCLSYPGIIKRIQRHTYISVQFQRVIGGRLQLERCGGYRARVIQHEVDHLKGICKVGDASYLDQLGGTGEATIVEQAVKKLNKTFLEGVANPPAMLASPKC
jgi:peptide deformylase